MTPLCEDPKIFPIICWYPKSVDHVLLSSCGWPPPGTGAAVPSIPREDWGIGCVGDKVCGAVGNHGFGRCIGVLSATPCARACAAARAYAGCSGILPSSSVRTGNGAALRENELSRELGWLGCWLPIPILVPATGGRAPGPEAARPTRREPAMLRCDVGT
jgi:hypothetical protein